MAIGKCINSVSRSSIISSLIHVTGLIQVVVHVNMLEGVPGVLAVLCAVENQSYEVPVAADDLTGIYAAHNLYKVTQLKQTGLSKTTRGF